MTYPEPKYLGDGGEVSTTYRPADSEPDLAYGPIARVHYLATGASTNGRFGLYRWEMDDPASGADKHFHRSISESFYILSGSVRVFDRERWIDARPGRRLRVCPRRAASTPSATNPAGPLRC